MCRMQCALALAALSVGFVHSWDFAITTGNRIEFYSNVSKTHSIESVQTKSLKTLTYEAVHDMLLFVDKQSDNASIFSFNISTNKFECLVTRKIIEDIAFDPVTGLLFWTDTVERSIYSISLKPGSKNNVYGNLLIMDDEIPMAIAVDSCRGYIYWTNINTRKPTIERARFDGSEREVIIDSDIHKPVSLVIDQLTKKIFWADDKENNSYTIHCADFNGENRKRLTVGHISHQEKALTVSKDFMYWIEYKDSFARAWQDEVKSTEPISNVFSQNFREMPSGIAANYKIEEQTQGISECEALTSLLLHKSVTNDSLNIPADFGLFCVHGIKVKGESLCECAPGYTGERCDVSVCQNYCFQGDCNVTAEGQPECRCSTGYSGDRCESSICSNYCLNNGVCFLNEQDEAVCQCNGNYEGSRCESINDITITTTLKYNSEEKNLNLVDLVSNH